MEIILNRDAARSTGIKTCKESTLKTVLASNQFTTSYPPLHSWDLLFFLSAWAVALLLSSLSAQWPASRQAWLCELRGHKGTVVSFRSEAVGTLPDRTLRRSGKMKVTAGYWYYLHGLFAGAFKSLSDGDQQPFLTSERNDVQVTCARYFTNISCWASNSPYLCQQKGGKNSDLIITSTKNWNGRKKYKSYPGQMSRHSLWSYCVPTPKHPPSHYLTPAKAAARTSTPKGPLSVSSHNQEVLFLHVLKHLPLST